MTEPPVTAASRPPRGAETLRVHMLRVLAVDGARPATVMLDRAPAAIGRQGAGTGAVVLDDTEVSRDHAVVEPGERGQWTIVDQGSRNGTFVDGRRIERARLAPGSVIRIGRTLIVYAEAELRGDERLAAPGDSRLVGDSVPALRLHAEIGLVAAKPLPVLVLGETGVGKELVAQQVHLQSPRGQGPFVELNCSAVPENLLESELFGFERGAFTDAKRTKKGVFEMASSGTLFLDEIGEMSLALQAKLLKVLESKTFRRLGGTVDITVDARVVAATNRDLKKEVGDGRFREDLYFRLQVIPIEVPPLRARKSDIAGLVAHFVERFSREVGRTTGRVHPEAMRLFEDYAWPGNVRELRNVIERIVLLESDDEIRPEHLPAEIVRPPGMGSTPATAGAAGGGAATGATASAGGGNEAGGVWFAPGKILPLADVEMRAIQHALACERGNKTRAAQLLGISRQTLRTKLKEHGVEEGGDSAEE